MGNQGAGTVGALPIGHAFTRSEKGTHSLAIKFRFTDGPGVGEEITVFRYFTDAARQYALADMETCGWDPKTPLVDMKLTKPVRLVLENKEYTNKDGRSTTSLRVKFINPPDGMPLKGQLSPHEVAGVESILLGRKPGATYRTPANTAPRDDAPRDDAPPEAYQDDNLPF